MGNSLAQAIPVGDIERMAVAIAKSGFFGVKTPEQAVALMLVAQAEGLHPAQAARDYVVIQGRPSLRADAMLARFQLAGGKVEWIEHTDTKVAGRFTHPQGGSVVIDWTLERARNANLTNKETWRAYPRQMLRARVISEGVRAVFPGVVVGTYSVEEVQDMTVEPPRTVIAAEPTLIDPVAKVREAPDMELLKIAYTDGIRAAKKVKNLLLEAALTEAKDARKAELEAVVVEVEA